MLTELTETVEMNNHKSNVVKTDEDIIELDPQMMETLGNPAVLKELFLKNENKSFLSHISEYNLHVEEGGSDNALNLWFDRHMKKIKENLIFNNLSAEAMEKITKDQNGEDNLAQLQTLNTNLKYYKQYMKVYEDFYAKNYEHLQIVRLNYLISNIKSAKKLDTKLQVKGACNKIADLFEKYLTSEGETDQVTGNDSLNIKKIQTYVLNILTSTIALFHNSAINQEVLLRCLDNLLLEFKNNFPSPNRKNFSDILSNVSYEVISAIEENLIILLELISEKIFRPLKDYSFDFKNGIFIRLFDMLKYFKSQNFLISLLFLMKEFKFYYPGDRIEKMNFSKIFQEENDLWSVLTGDNSINIELEKIKESKSEIKLKLSEILEKLESFGEEEISRLKDNFKNMSFNILSDDDRFYYVIIDSFLIKLETLRNNENNIILTRTNQIIEFPDKNNLKKVNCILKKSCVYLLIQYTNEFLYFIYDKENLNMINKTQFENPKLLDGESLGHWCLNNNDYFFIFIKNKLILEEQKGISQLKLIRLKAKKYDANKLETLIERKKFFASREYRVDEGFMDLLGSEKLSFERFISEFLKDSNNFNSFFFNDEIIIFHEPSKSLYKFKIELDKKNKNFIFSNYENSVLKYDFIMFPSFYYNTHKNTFTYFTKNANNQDKNITINIDEFKSFSTNPYPNNYLNKNFLKNKLSYLSYLKEVKNKNMLKTSENSSRETRVLNILNSKKINKDKISNLQEKPLNENTNIDIDSQQKISQVFYLFTLYNFVKNILLTSNSKIFNSNLKDEELHHIIKYLTSPFSFSCDNNPFTFHLIYKYIFSQVNFDLTLENLFYVVILKNYFQNLVSLGIDIKNYLQISNKDEKDKLMELVKFLFFQLKNLTLIYDDKIIEKDEIKLYTLFFNEILDVLQIFISQSFEINTEEFMSIINTSKNFDQKIKLVSFFSNILLHNNDFDFKKYLTFFLNFEKDIIFGRDKQSFSSNLINFIKYTNQISNFSTNFKINFMKKFSNDISKLFSEEKNKSASLLEELIEVFSKELNDILIEVISRKEEILLNTNNRNIFFEYAKTKSITFNITFFLIQIFITQLMNNKENNSKPTSSVLPYIYLKKIINLYTSLEKINSLLFEQASNTGDEVFYYIDTEHPLPENKSYQRVYPIHIKGEKLFINFDILSSNQSDCQVRLSTQDLFGGEDEKIFSSHKTKNLPINTIIFKKSDVDSSVADQYLIIDVKQEKSNEIKNNKDYFVNEYGLKMIVTNKKPLESNIFSEIRKSILYSINIIISDNLVSNECGLENQENQEKTLSIKNKAHIYNSLFNSKLLKYISLPDSQTFIKRENIGFINNIIQSIEDEKLKIEIASLFQRNNNSDDDLDLIRTYSKEVSLHKEKENHTQQYVNNIVSNSENSYKSGIYYLQKILSKKNAYLVNLGGKEVEPLVIHLFTVVLKYQNLITNYVEKYLHEIHNLESLTKSDSSEKLNSKFEIKNEELHNIHKIENFDIFLKIWTECSKIRIWFLERKMILAEDLEKNKNINEANSIIDLDYDQEILKMLSGLETKAKFFLSIINPANNSNGSTGNHQIVTFSSEIVESLLLCIKNENITSDKIYQKIHMQNEIGIKRETGLILLNMYLNLISDENEEDLNDLIYHFNKILRKDQKVIDLIDDLTGADFKVIERVKTQFHILIENLILRSLKLKSLSLISVIQTLIWKLKGRDYPVMNNLKVFEKFTKVYNSFSSDGLDNIYGSKNIFGKEEINKQTLCSIFDQFFEIYAYQIFRRIGSSTIENKEQSSMLGLSRSISSINEEDNYKMIEFILNIINPILENFIRSPEDKEKSSEFDLQRIKKFLMILYRGFNSSKDVITMITTIDPNLFVNLLKLYKNEKLSKCLDIKFLLIKIHSVFFKSIGKIDEGIFNYIIKNSIQLENNSSQKISININNFSILVDYLLDEISYLKSNNEEKSYCLLYELLDTFKNFFSIENSEYKKLFNDKMKNLIKSDLDLVLIIIGHYPKTITVGSSVLINTNHQKREEKEFDLESTSTNTNYKRARVIGFAGSKFTNKNNPFELNEECKNEFSITVPEISYSMNNNKNIENAYLILDESLCFNSIKDSSFKIIREYVRNLIVDNYDEKISYEIVNFIVENSIISHLLNSVIINEEIPLERKYLAYKFIYESLNLEEGGELGFQVKKLILDELLKNDKLSLLLNTLLKNSKMNFDTIQDKYNIQLFFTSLENLENNLQYEILNSKISQSSKEEFSENFTYYICHDENCIKISRNKRTEIIPFIGTYNYEKSEKNNFQTYNKLSFFRERENQRIIFKKSILFVESETLKKNEYTKIILEICKENEIKYILTEQLNVSDLNEKFNEEKINLTEFPSILFVNKYTYFSMVSYFFFISEGEDKENFYFKYDNLIQLEESNSNSNASKPLFEITIDKEDIDPDSMLFFAGCEEEIVNIKFEEDKFEENRDKKILQERLNKFNLPCKILMEKLVSLTSKRILIHLANNIKNFEKIKIFEFFFSSINIDDLIFLFKSLIQEYTYNLNLSPLEMKNLTIKNLLRNLILSLNDTHPLGKTVFSYLLDFNSDSLNCQNIKNYNRKYYKVLIDSKPTESNVLLGNDLKYESIETKLKILEFILENKFDDVDEINKNIFYKEFLKKLCDMILEASKGSKENKASGLPHLQKILTNILKISTRILFKQILSNSNNSFITFLKDNKDTIFPIEKIKNLVSIFQPLFADKIDEKETKNKVEELSHICSFFFSYFDIILYSLFKFGISFSDSIAYWVNNKDSPSINKIFDLYYTFLIYTKKFNYSAEDYRVFITLLLNNQEKIKSLMDIANEGSGNQIKVLENLYGKVYNKLNKMYFNENEISMINLSIIPDCDGENLNTKNLNPIFVIDNNKNLQEFYCKDEELTSLKNSTPYFPNIHNNTLSYFTLPNLPKTLLYSFGKNDNLNLACGGNLGEYHEPQLTLGMEESSRVKVFNFGLHYSFALDYNGTLYVAGWREGSSLENFEIPIPKFTSDNLFNQIAQKEGGVKNIYANNYYSSIMITNSNKLYGCGLNSSGCLSKAKPENDTTNTPFEMDSLPEDSPVIHIAIGFKNTLVILENGNAYTLGDNSFNQCGKLSDQMTVLDWYKLKLPEGYKKFVHAAAGEYFFLLLIEDNEGKVKLFSMGSNEKGRSGVGDDRTRALKLCHGVENIEFKYISTRDFSCAAISKDGKLYTWGINESGCLGLGDSSLKFVNVPTLVEFFSIRKIIVDTVSIANSHMLVVARKMDFRGNYVKTIYVCGEQCSAIGQMAPLKIYVKEPTELTYFYDNNLVPVRVFSSMYQSFVLTLPRNDIRGVDNHAYASCKECKIVKLTKIVYIDSTPEVMDYTCKDCIYEIKSLDINSFGIYYSLTTSLQDEKVKNLFEYLKKIDITYLNNHLIKINSSINDQIQQSTSNETLVYSCTGCLQPIDPHKILNISTENFDLILCTECLINNSEKILYPQVFYSFKNCYIPKSKLDMLLKFEFSEFLYDVPHFNSDLSEEVQRQNKNKNCSYKIIINTLDKLENKLVKSYNSENVTTLEKILKKVDTKILVEFSELKEEYLSTLNSSEEKYTISEILNHLKTFDQSKFNIIRNLLKSYETDNDSQSELIFNVVDEIIKKINNELPNLMNINTLTSESIFKNAISENLVYISKKNRIKIFYTKLETHGNRNQGNKTLAFNRFKARKFYEKNIPDLTSEETLFGQLHNKLKDFEIKKLQTRKDERLFTVQFTGEGASDAGGPYRELFSSICEELQSISLDLFIKSPNSKGEVGSMRDKFILNPSATLSIHEAMYTTLGKLFGHALFSGNMLGLNLHPVIWKLILNIEVKFYEFETVDKIFYKLITDLEKNSNNVSREDFEYLYDLNFTLQLSDGKEKEILPGGKSIQVSFENKEKFINLAKEERVREFNLQAEWMRRGLYEIVPEYLLQILTWRDFEELVCGKPTVNIEHLKKCTDYSVRN
jgi:alpha-tubulin suppressor-like RCC1 family protein